MAASIGVELALRDRPRQPTVGPGLSPAPADPGSPSCWCRGESAWPASKQLTDCRRRL